EEFVNEPIVSEPTLKKHVVETSEAKASADKPKVVRKNFCSPLIKDWISDSKDEAESKPMIEKKTVKPSFAKIEFVKSKEQRNPQQDLQDKGVINSGCSRHMTGNMSYLTNYEEIYEGYVAFRGNLKGGKIIENLVDHNLKVIRCDNQTEFKNREMNQFCEMKAIMRQYSVARTPQQKGVAKRRNRTLIEAARTMLADSKLLTTFWAKAVNTACYVQNRVLVVKPHNKTPYELVHGKTPALSFMRPFGCHDTIHNTKDHLGKFNGCGPDWLFDIDALTRIMNYEPIVVGTQSNNFAGSKANDNAVNIAGANTNNELPFDSKMPALEDISKFNFSSDHEDDDEMDDMNNLDKKIEVSPNTTTIIHKNHPLDQVIRDLH
nr:ribonuclease H-like domain-containing protein [Tanacetum cinerariifolium]